MKNIRPITDLRKTSEISELAHQIDEPIFITKNGYNDLVVMSDELYRKYIKERYYNSFSKDKDNFKNKDVIYQPVNNNFNMVRVACFTNNVHVANVEENAKEIIKAVLEKQNDDLDILVFPELALTGYSCLDLFYQQELLDKVVDSLYLIAKETKNVETLFYVGAPLVNNDNLYNCAIAFYKGEILVVIPKSYLPNYNEFYEARQFVEFHEENSTILLKNKYYPFGTKFLLVNENQPALKVAAEICEDIWTVKTPSTDHVLAGATIIVNLSASDEYIGKCKIRHDLVKSTSKRLLCGYVYSCSGNGESTQDVVYASHNLICEDGHVLKESKLFNNEYIKCDIDLDIILAERRKNTAFSKNHVSGYQIITFSKKGKERKICRLIPTNPFLDTNPTYEDIINIQVMGLIKRLTHIKCQNVVLGFSGGLDSTLALIVCVEAFKKLHYDLNNIHTILLPCFGTSSRTLNNSLNLTSLLKTHAVKIDISNSVKQHLKDIEHDINNTNIVYENAQARERTQVLFDYANKVNGIVIGTGDLSELVLGWCTFNGDHMSNYGVNASIPKTLVKFAVKGYANNHLELKEVLYDILDTPISPELLPLDNDTIVQKSEDAIGPYELHDFFLFYFLRYTLSFKKIFFLAKNAFKEKYNEQEIEKYLKIFISRFFSSQFKRSTLPDGPKVTMISLSPRGDFKMPSDACKDTFMNF